MVIAKPKTSASEAALAAVFRAYGLEPRPAQTELDPNIYLTGPGVLTDPLAVCETLNKTGLFEYTQPNCLRFVATAGTPNDPLYAANWGLAKMNLPAAWDIILEFANAELLDAMPTRIDLYSEKSLKPVHSLILKEAFDNKAFQDGNRIELNVSGLPRGIYHLHATLPGNGIEKLKFILE